MRIRNDLFRIQIQLWIFRVPDPDTGQSSGSMRIRIRNTEKSDAYLLSFFKFFQNTLIEKLAKLYS